MKTGATLNKLLLSALLLISPQTLADTPFSFELDLEQQRIPLTGGTQLESNGFAFRYQEHLSDHIGLEMLLGRLDTDHKQDGTAAGFNPGGYYAGLGLNLKTDERRQLQGGLDLSYRYYDNDAQANDEQLDISWTQGEARLWLALRLGQRFKLYGCALALKLDGDQKLQATTPSRTELENRDDSGECAGLIMATDDYGYVGIEGSGGARQGGRIYFGRRF